MKLYLSLLVLVGLVAFCMSAPAADNLEDNPADENLLEDVEAPETDEIQNDEDLDKNAEESEDEAQEDENPVENAVEENNVEDVEDTAENDPRRRSRRRPSWCRRQILAYSRLCLRSPCRRYSRYCKQLRVTVRRCRCLCRGCRRICIKRYRSSRLSFSLRLHMRNKCLGRCLRVC
ncbi:uncharacterized protein LOC110245424 [Exaiptasia diaphana]|uniref:Uncharacterized protein n=1 Tax=Exaiptasia diaphana TaxID=2652724 RepID=A0A913XNZ3_EXADI|nr:uncharacterized protein LOC110245424 [Exaiptasia diaphana]